MANLRGDARSESIDEKDGKVVSFEQTTVVTDPESDLAVQIPEGVSGENDNPLGVHQEESPNDVFGDGPHPNEGDAPKAKPKAEPAKAESKSS